MKCPDCGTGQGHPHLQGCDVARCTLDGRQRLSCNHRGGYGHIWTGRFPGEQEVDEGLATDLNDLAIRVHAGLLRWDGQRWHPRNTQ